MAWLVAMITWAVSSILAAASGEMWTAVVYGLIALTSALMWLTDRLGRRA